MIGLVYKCSKIQTRLIVKIKTEFLFQEFLTVLLDKVLELLKKNEGPNPEKWLTNLAVDSIHLREGDTFAK